MCLKKEAHMKARTGCTHQNSRRDDALGGEKKGQKDGVESTEGAEGLPQDFCPVCQPESSQACAKPQERPTSALRPPPLSPQGCVSSFQPSVGPKTWCCHQSPPLPSTASVHPHVIQLLSYPRPAYRAIGTKGNSLGFTALSCVYSPPALKTWH